jgi:hypothetical protein
VLGRSENKSVAQSIEVTAPGIHAYGVNCAHLAVRVASAAASPPQVTADSVQATAVAVGAIHGAVGFRAAALADSMALVARGAVSSAVHYVDSEAANTNAVAAVV